MKYPGNCGRVSALLGLNSTVHPPFRLSETRRLKSQPSHPRSMKGMDISNFFTNNDICILHGFEFWSLMQRCRKRCYSKHVLYVQDKYRQRIAQMPATDLTDHWSTIREADRTQGLCWWGPTRPKRVHSSLDISSFFTNFFTFYITISFYI